MSDHQKLQPLLQKTNFTLPTTPTNVIFMGVAGTGKTHKLLSIQKHYDEVIEASWNEWRAQQLQSHSWCDVICVVLLLEKRMMTVPEITGHRLVRDKAEAQGISDNLSQAIWSSLGSHAHPNSRTVNKSKRSANYYFDKTEESQWYLLDEAKDGVQLKLAELIALYDLKHNSSTAHQHKISRSCLVSFHQSYGYDEFVEGIRPQINQQTGQMQYAVKAGTFVELCAKAIADPEHRYVMLIDEINRANTAQVFGELMSVIEPSKRAGSNTPMSVRLAYSGQQFSVPDNVDIYATMNTQDHSLAALDMAFRRRFEFVMCEPDSSIVASVYDADGVEVDVAQLMEALNHRLVSMLGVEAQLGHSYFMGMMTISELARCLHRKVIPQIVTYIEQTVTTSEVSVLLHKILYGDDEQNQPLEGSLLRQSIQGQTTNSYRAHAHSQISFEPDLIIAANRSYDKRDGDEVKLDNPVNLFLTAQPYRLIYE